MSKVKICRATKKRKVVGYLHKEGVVLPFKDNSGKGQKNVFLNLEEGFVTQNGIGEVGKMPYYSEEDTIYEGDSVTLQF